MTIISADFIFICDEKFEILENNAICFDEKILEIANIDTLKKSYPHATFITTPPNTILMPGLINPHTHLEFSANRALLEYGSFVPWLNSVIKNRDEIMELSTKKNMQEALDEMILSGTTTIGAISSQGLDLDVCVNSKANIVYFNEILGSNPSSVDIIFEDFKNRFNLSLKFKSEKFIPSLSVHSPYSTHPILAKHTLDIARKENLVVSTHFLESKAEKEWLHSSSGDFYEFFKAFNPSPKSFLTPLEYLELFYDCKTIFTHCTQVNEKELDFIKSLNASITHCPTSNRLLGTQLMDFDLIDKKGINLTIGTDGYSSNRSLNLWEELRIALFSHFDLNLEDFAKKLLLNATRNGANALHVNSGELKIGKNSDIIALSLPQMPKNLNQLALQVILHVNKPIYTFIQGEKIGQYRTNTSS